MVTNGTVTAAEYGPGFSEIDTCTIPLSDSLALRISSDTAPSKWKTTGLQKGLRLIFNGTEMVGEGVGFGVPVLLCSGKPYFSGSSRLYLYAKNDLKVIRKEFVMDRVPNRLIGRIELHNRLMIAFWKYLDDIYMKHRRLRFIVNLSLSKRIGIRTGFSEVHPIGKIAISYHINRKHIHVKVDPTLSNNGEPTKMIMLNEQGAGLFRRYSEGNGRELIDKGIGAWERVDADSASMTDIRGAFGFNLKREKDSLLIRGREFIKGFQDWAGIEHEISSRDVHAFEYDIEILGV
jgi:hypothetical protein